MALCGQFDGDRRLLLKQAAVSDSIAPTGPALLRSGKRGDSAQHRIHRARRNRLVYSSGLCHFSHSTTEPRTLSTYTVVFDAFN